LQQAIVGAQAVQSLINLSLVNILTLLTTAPANLVPFSPQSS